MTAFREFIDTYKGLDIYDDGGELYIMSDGHAPLYLWSCVGNITVPNGFSAKDFLLVAHKWIDIYLGEKNA